MSKEVTVEENLDYLQMQAYYFGFDHRKDEEIAKATAKALEEGKDSFSLAPDITHHRLPTSKEGDHATYNKLEAELFYKRGKDSDLFFLNHIRAELTPVEGEKRQQYFSTEYGKAYTLKEMANWLDGGAVCKKWMNQGGDMYMGWKWADFENKKANGNFREQIMHTDHSFDVLQAMDKEKINYLNEKHPKQIFDSLRRGNYQEGYVTNSEGRTEKFWFRANPNGGGLDKYDATGKLVHKAERQQEQTKSTTQQQGRQPDQANRAVQGGQGNDHKKKSHQQRGRKPADRKPKERLPEGSAGKGHRR